MTPAADLPPLVDSAWLEREMKHGGRSLRVLDARGHMNKTQDGNVETATYASGREEYLRGHVPGAVYVDWPTDTTDPDDPIPVQLADADRFSNWASSVGVDDDTRVVVYDHVGGHFATRLWWSFAYYGHSLVAVLDGGWERWVGEKRPVSTGETTVPHKEFQPRPQAHLRVNGQSVNELLKVDDAHTVIVDARDSAEYTGELMRSGGRPGHIPGAVNVAYRSLLNLDTGRWWDLEEIRRRFREAGVEPESDQKVIAYCNGGVAATGVLFCLHRLGHERYSNYDGSWNEWSTFPDAPVER